LRPCGTQPTSSECTLTRWRPHELADRVLPGYRVKLDNGNVRLEKKLTWQLPEPKLERRAPQGEDVSTLVHRSFLCRSESDYS
jgi:hypothetical protein